MPTAYASKIWEVSAQCLNTAGPHSENSTFQTIATSERVGSCGITTSGKAFCWNGNSQSELSGSWKVSQSPHCRGMERTCNVEFPLDLQLTHHCFKRHHLRGRPISIAISTPHQRQPRPMCQRLLLQPHLPEDNACGQPGRALHQRSWMVMNGVTRRKARRCSSRRPMTLSRIMCRASNSHELFLWVIISGPAPCHVSNLTLKRSVARNRITEL